MKKLVILLAALLCLTACEKKEVSNSNSGSEDNNSGKKKTVVIGASANYGQTKVIGADAGTQFNFTWEKGDKIKIIDNIYGETYELKLKTGAGTSSATFEGELPEDLLLFDIQYPVENPNLKKQTYKEGKVDSGLMRFSKTDCELDAEGKCNVTLEPQYAILQLNLYGVARSVDTIKVKDVESSEFDAILACNPDEGVLVGKDKDHATPFYIVIDEAGTSVQLRVDVTMNEGTPESSDLADYETYGKGIPISCKTFAQSSEEFISKGSCVNMPAISLTTIWAPVNCGYDPVNFKYGKLYQWGRKDGSGYIDYYAQTHGQTFEYDDAGGIVQTSPNPGSITSQITESEENPNYYYNTTYLIENPKQKGDSISVNTDWLSDPNNKRWDATGGSEAVHFATKTQYDPCPEGWRVPTKTEMETLMGSNTSTDEFPISTHGSTTGVAGRWFNASTETTPETGVFLPVTGYRNSLKTAACAYRQTVSATYWTSSASGERACSMVFGRSSKPSVSSNSNRSRGFAVRCVQE